MKSDYFEREDGLKKLLETYQDIFTLIDDIGDQLLQNMITTSDEYRKVLNQMTGAFTALEPLYSMSIAYKENHELKYYVARKRELEGLGEKVVAASLDKEACEAVSELRRIRNILEGYVSATEKIIITCQTQLKRIEDEYRYKPQETK